MRSLLPQSGATLQGYSNEVEVEAGRIVFVAGQVGCDAQQTLQSKEMAPQFDQTLANVIDVLKVTGAARSAFVA